MYKLFVSNQFSRDLKLARKRGLDVAKLTAIVTKLQNGQKLPPKNKDHNLIGDYKGCRECHVTPDWLLIYSVNTEINLLKLLRTGTHSDLF